MKTALVDMGGGMRGAFSSGIYDRLMDENYSPFDFGVGVSAGAANLAAFISRQRGRELRYYLEYSKRKEYMSFGNFIRTGNYLNLEYIYHTLSNPGMEDPFDMPAFHSNPMGLIIVATDAVTGKSAYFDKTDLKEGDLRALMASAALPVLCKPVGFQGGLYYDGGISDPIPYIKAFESGADRVVVVLSRPIDFRRDKKNDRLFGKILSHKYPESGKALLNRADTYNEQADLMGKYIEEGRIFAIYPDELFGITTSKRTDEGIMSLYEHGYSKAAGIISFLS